MLFLSETVRVICKFRLARRLEEVGHGMYGIEEQFKVERSFFSLGVGTHYEVAANIGVSEERIFGGRTHRSLFETQEVGNLRRSAVCEETISLKNRHIVEKHIYVAHLVGRN